MGLTIWSCSTAVNDFPYPRTSLTKEFNDSVRTVLKPSGVYLLTIIDLMGDGKLWKAAMATLKQTFPAGGTSCCLRTVLQHLAAPNLATNGPRAGM